MSREYPQEGTVETVSKFHLSCPLSASNLVWWSGPLWDERDQKIRDQISLIFKSCLWTCIIKKCLCTPFYWSFIVSKVICIYKYIILTCYVFRLTSCRAFHSWGPSWTPHSVLESQKTKKTKKRQISLGAFPSTTETRCSSSLTEVTKHLAKGGEEMAATLALHHVDSGESSPLLTASLSD